MTKRYRAYIGPSESQSKANAEALVRRGAPYTAASDASVRIAWDWRQREPKDLREAVRLVRKAYADEVPDKLHDGPDAIGEGGTPRMTARAEGYIFGSATASDARPLDDELVSYYHTPFRAALCRLQHGSAPEQRRGRIVSHVTIGQMGPVEAAIAEKAHPFDAKLVAFDALRSFLHGMTDMRLHLPTEDHLAESVTAA